MKRKIAALLAGIMCFAMVPQATFANVSKPADSVLCAHNRGVQVVIVGQSRSTLTHGGEKNNCTVTTVVTDYATICMGCGATLETHSTTTTSHSNPNCH